MTRPARISPAVCFWVLCLLCVLYTHGAIAADVDCAAFDAAQAAEASEAAAGTTSDLRCNTDFDPENFKTAKICGMQAEIRGLQERLATISSEIQANAIEQQIASKQEQLANYTSGDGIITSIVNQIQGILKNSYETMYEAIRASNVANIASACMMLYVIMFGIMFALGMIQMPLNDGIKRIVKMIFVALIVGEGGLAFFNETIYKFFREGTDALLSEMTTIIASRIGGGDADMYMSGDGEIGPFKPMDVLIESLVNPSTLQILQTGASTPPYGTIYIIILLVGFVFLLGAIARALWVYLVSLIATTFLFGLAPLFVITILFERTKNMFSAWLNQLINFSLQPILMFTFIGFFIILMQESITSILDLEVCYGAMPNTPVTGSPWEPVGLQFTQNGQILSVDFQTGGMKCVVAATLAECPTTNVAFPLDLIDILTFLLLGYVAYQFYNYVIDIASDISGSFVNLEVGSPVSNLLQDIGSRIDQGVASAVTSPSGDFVGAFMQGARLGIPGAESTPPPTTPPRTP